MLVAAGASSRMGFDKIWVELGNRPLVEWSLRSALAAGPAEIVLVLSTERLPDAWRLIDSARMEPGESAPDASTGAHPQADGTVESGRTGPVDNGGTGRFHGDARHGAVVPVRALAGGPRRRDSVHAGVLAARSPWVAIHDAARALADPALFARGLAAARATGAAVPVVPLKDTIKRIQNGLVVASIERSHHAAVQTPQVFRRDTLLAVLAATTDDATDEAALLESVGLVVATFEGREENFKVTTPQDLALARLLVQKQLANAR